MSLVDLLIQDDVWQKFLEHKKSLILSNKVIARYETYINNHNYKSITQKIVSAQYTFSIPQKVLISKMGKAKKRTVYSYNTDETYILKMLSFLLYKYDYLFAPNLYSFRQHSGVKKAISDLIASNIKSKYAYKVDIKNYFNSIPISNLMPRLKKDLNDEKLYKLLHSLLCNKQVLFKNSILEEEKGIMAGVPISSFLANYYLKDLDSYFHKHDVTYCRYADDIIVFDDKENIQKHQQYITNYLKDHGLEINSEKEFFYTPGEKIEFLGFSFNGNVIDLSNNSIKKMKAKIRRSARSFRRWMIRKNATPEATLKAMNRKFNRKFYGKSEDDLSWKYWFFPTINTSKSLKLLDNYMQEWQRYVVTGAHNKKNFSKVPYHFLKACNYKPLVHEYFEIKNKKNYT